MHEFGGFLLAVLLALNFNFNLPRIKTCTKIRFTLSDALTPHLGCERDASSMNSFDQN